MMTWLSRLVGADRAPAILAIVIAIVVLIGTIILLRSCQDDGGAQIEQSTKAAEAYSDAAAEAVNTVVSANDREASVDQVVTQATKEIDNAHDPDAARLAVIRATCRLRAYSRESACIAMQRANPE